MRVLFITGEFPPTQGGVGDCTNEIAQALSRRGADVSVLTTQISDSAFRIPRATFFVAPHLRILRIIPHWDWSQRGPILKTIASLKPDIVHIQYQTGAFGQHPMVNFLPRFIPPPGKPNGIGVAVTFHDLLPAYLFPKAGPLRDWVTFQLARGADAVIATNEADYRRLRDKVRDLHKWLELVPIGSNIVPSEIPPQISREKLRERLGVGEEETLLVYFGFLNASKGAETLIRALYDLPKCKLLFLGGQTGSGDPTNISFRDLVKKEIGELGLEDRVIWTDYMPAEAVSAHFYASDICVLPYGDGASFRRGSLMAALAHGMPIVTTYPQTTPEPELRTRDEKMDAARIPKLPALRDGENAQLVPPGDPQAVIMAVTRIRTSPGLAAQLSSGARLTARPFSWDKIAQDHLALYDKMCHSATAR